jgi:hypothetical protein
VLVGVLVTLGILARSNEITAMKAGGISVYRAAMPVLAMGFAASVLLYVAQEWVLPDTNKQALLGPQRDQGPAGAVSDQFEKRWMLASDGRFYNFDYIVERKGSAALGLAERGRRRAGEFSVYGLSVYDVDPARWELRERLFTVRAVLERRAGAPTSSTTAGRRATGRHDLVPALPEPARARRSARTLAARLERPPTSSARRSRPTRCASASCGLHRLARGARLRRGQAARAAAPEAGVPDGRPS